MRMAIAWTLFVLAVALWAVQISWAQTSTDNLSLIVKNVSRADGLILVEPATPVIFGVTIDSGNKALTEGDALNCKLKERSVPATVEGQAGSKVTTMLFDCGKTKLVFKRLGAEAPGQQEQ